MTQPIHPDRSAVTVPDRERPLPARGDAAGRAATEPVASSPAATAPRDTADVAKGAALLRAAARHGADDAPVDAAQAAAKVAHVAALLRGEPARAVQAYAGIRRDDVQALLATA